MKKIPIIFIMFLTMYCSGIYAQVNQEWVATFSGTGFGNFTASKNATDKSGNLIVAGRAELYSTDYLVLKYNPSGNLLWSNTYDGNSNGTDFLRDMILDDSGNVYVTGNSREIEGAYNWVTIKYNYEGILIWKKSLDWTLHKEDVPFSITLDKDRNVLVAGYCWALPDGLQNFDIVTAKYNNDGEELWTRSYNSKAFHADWGYSVVTDDSCNAYVSGYAYFRNIVTIKYSKDGNQIWVKEYPRMSGEFAIPLYSKIDKLNNIIVNGYYQVAGQSNFVTLKYNRDGNQIWDRIFDSPIGASDYAHSLFIDDSSNVYIGGSTFGMFFNDFLLIKYSPAGDTLLLRTYDGGVNQTDVGNSIIVDTNLDIYLTGRSYIKSDNFLTIKYSKSGEILWLKKYIQQNNNIPYSICLDQNNSIFVSGSNVLGINSYVLLTIKYSQLTDIKNTYSEISSDFILYNYPNPFNPETDIKYTLNRSGNLKIEVFDIQGKSIKLLIDENKKPGNYKLKFNGSNLLSGIYFCTLELNGIRLKTIKLLLLK